MVVGASSSSSSTLAVGPEDKEGLRHEARRQREQERLKKLGPGRLRTIGADIAGVKNQIDEQKRHDDAERDAQRQAHAEDAAIRRYLIQVESEDALAKRKEMVTLRNDWHLQAADRDRQRQHDARDRATPLEPESCAPGAAQKFHGEDPQRLERTRLQAMQLRQWTLAQMDDKRQRRALDADDERAFAGYLAEIERIQQSLHTATERERTQIALELQRFNQWLRDDKRERERRRHEREQAMDAQEIQLTLQSHLVSENPLQAQLAPGVPLEHRVRVDHWKGLSTAATKTILAHNEELLAQKALAQQQSRAEDALDARRQLELNRILVEEDHNVQRHKAMAQLAIQDARDKQAKENAEREQRNAQQARGKIEPTFFQNFGRSYR